MAIVLLELFLSHYVLNDAGVEKDTIWGGKRFIQWSEIESIAYIDGRYGGDEFRIKGAGKTISLPLWLEGINVFSRMVVARVPPDKWAESKHNILNMVENVI